MLSTGSHIEWKSEYAICASGFGVRLRFSSFSWPSSAHRSASQAMIAFRRDPHLRSRRPRLNRLRNRDLFRRRKTSPPRKKRASKRSSIQTLRASLNPANRRSRRRRPQSRSPCRSRHPWPPRRPPPRRRARPQVLQRLRPGRGRRLGARQQRSPRLPLRQRRQRRSSQSALRVMGPTDIPKHRRFRRLQLNPGRL